MKMLLLGRGVWHVVISTDPSSDKDFIKNNNIALAEIILHTNSQLQLLLSNYDSAKEAWDKLVEMFDKRDKFIRNQLERDLRILKMSVNETAFDHISKLETLYQQLVSNGKSIDDEDRAIILLLSIEHIPRFHSICSTLRLQAKLNYSDTKDLILEQENRDSSKKDIRVKEESTALINRQSNYNPRPFCQFCKRLGHVESKCYKKMGHGKYSSNNIGFRTNNSIVKSNNFIREILNK